MHYNPAQINGPITADCLTPPQNFDFRKTVSGNILSFLNDGNSRDESLF
jgi:hypothetical protein